MNLFRIYAAFFGGREHTRHWSTLTKRFNIINPHRCLWHTQKYTYTTIMLHARLPISLRSMNRGAARAITNTRTAIKKGERTQKYCDLEKLYARRCRRVVVAGRHNALNSSPFANKRLMCDGRGPNRSSEWERERRYASIDRVASEPPAFVHHLYNKHSSVRHITRKRSIFINS